LTLFVKGCRIGSLDKGVAPAVVAHPEAGPQERSATVDEQKSSVFRPTEVGEDTHPHACCDGLVFLAYTVFDEEAGKEVEKIEIVPCRRCILEGR
jgi:hypothetical protein